MTRLDLDIVGEGRVSGGKGGEVFEAVMMRNAS